MKLPHADQAVVDIRKLIEYCLSPDHPRGKHKARVFESACGLTSQHAEFLRAQLLEAAREGDAVLSPSIGYGNRYVVEWSVEGPTGSALARTAWIVRQGEDFPRFVSAYIIEEPSDETAD